MPGIGISNRVGKSSISWQTYWKPLNVILIIYSSTRIDISWTNTYSKIDGIIIERSSNGVDYSVIDTVGATINSYSDTGLSSNSYYYRLRYYKGVHYGDYSNTASDYLVPAYFTDSNTVGWHKASDVAKITKDQNNIVSAWAAEHGYDFVYGKCKWDVEEGMIFNDGVSDDHITTVNFGLVQPFILYAVIKFREPLLALDRPIFDGIASGSNMLITYSGDLYMWCGGTSFKTNTPIPNNQWCILKAVFNGASSKLGFNDDVMTSGNPGNATPYGLCFGAAGNNTSNSKINLKESFARNVTLSPSEELELINYLKYMYF
jgi:hypothetical protein